MKYSFVFDQDYLNEKMFFLSKEEIQLIQCVITGGHNVCLRGFKPERIVDAIKTVVYNTQTVIEPPLDISFQDFVGGGPELSPGAVSLANNGILIMKNLNEFKYSVVEMLTLPMDSGTISLVYDDRHAQHPAKFQLIATLSARDSLNASHHVVSKCEIDYVCKNNTTRSVVKASELKKCVESVWNHHLYMHNSDTKNQEITNFESKDFTTQAWEEYEMKIKSSYSNPWKIARVARTIADMREHTYIRCADLETAEALHIPQFE